MSYDHLYDCIKKLLAAVELHERESSENRANGAKLAARVRELEEELAREKANAARQEEKLQHRLTTIKELQQQRDSLRAKNDELNDRLAALGRKTSASGSNSPFAHISKNSFSSIEATNSVTPSAPSTPHKTSLPPIPVNPAPAESDTDTEEMDDSASAGSGAGTVVVSKVQATPPPPSGHAPLTGDRSCASQQSPASESPNLVPNGASVGSPLTVPAAEAVSVPAPATTSETLKSVTQGLKKSSPKEGSSRRQLRKIGRALSYDTQPNPAVASSETAGRNDERSSSRTSSVGSRSETQSKSNGTVAPCTSQEEEHPRADLPLLISGASTSISSRPVSNEQTLTGGDVTTTDLTAVTVKEDLERKPGLNNGPCSISETLGKEGPTLPSPQVPSEVGFQMPRPAEMTPTEMTEPKQVPGEETKLVSGEEGLKSEMASLEMSEEKQVSRDAAQKQGSRDSAQKQWSGEEAPKAEVDSNPKSELCQKAAEAKSDTPLPSDSALVPTVVVSDDVPKPALEQEAPANKLHDSKVTAKDGSTSTQVQSRSFSRCRSEDLLIPSQATDDLELTTIREEEHVDKGGEAEMRKRTNTFSPASKQMIGRRTPKDIKRVEKKMMELRKDAALPPPASRKDASDVLKYLSPDIEARIYEMSCRHLAKTYGGLQRATQAAVTVQRAYRAYKLRKYFEGIRKDGPSASRKRTATVRDKNRRLSIKNRPLRKREDEMARVQETVDKLNSKRHSPGRNRVTSRWKGAEVKDVPPPLPPPLHPDNLPLGGEEAESSAVVTTAGEYPSGGGATVEGQRNAEGIVAAGGSPRMDANPRISLTISSGASQGSIDEQEDVGFKMPKSQSVELPQHRRISVFSLGSSGSGDGGGDSGEAGGTKGLRKKLSAAMVTKSLNIGTYQFNRKPTQGLQYLVAAGVLQDNPESVAKFLKHQYGLSKMKIGEFLGEIYAEFNMAVLEHLAGSTNMQDKPIDEALREFQTLFRMPGEAQKIDKIMQIFAAEYFKVNKGVFETEDAVYVLSFSIMMLHTSLHNPSVKNKPSKEQWLKTNRGLNNGHDFPEQMLLDIYCRIQKTQFATALDHTQKVMEIQQQLEGSEIRDLVAPHRRFICEVAVNELEDINHWYGTKTATHRRILLIFSDLVIVSKKGNKDQYRFKKTFSLFNAAVMPYQSTDKHGVQVLNSFDQKILFQCECDSSEESMILKDKLINTIDMLKELEKDRIEMLGTSVEMRRYSTTTSTEGLGEIMVPMSCNKPSKHGGSIGRRNSLESSYMPLIKAANSSQLSNAKVAKSMEDISQHSQMMTPAKSMNLQHLSPIPPSPSDSNLTSNTKQPLRETKSSSPDPVRLVERTKSESSKKGKILIKRTKTQAEKKEKKPKK